MDSYTRLLRIYTHKQRQIFKVLHLYKRRVVLVDGSPLLQCLSKTCLVFDLDLNMGSRTQIHYADGTYHFLS